MKRFLLILATFLLSKTLLAEHITGGEMYYTFMGFRNRTISIQGNIKTIPNCGPVGAQLDAAAGIAVFDKTTGSMFWQGQSLILRQERTDLRLPVLA